MIQIGHMEKTPLSSFMDSLRAGKNLWSGAALLLLLIMAIFAQPGFAAKLGIVMEKEKTIDLNPEEDIVEFRRRELAKITEERLYWGSFVASSNPSLSDNELSEIGRAVLKYSSEYGLPPSLIIAVIKVESSGRTSVVSHKGAQGLMQVMPFWKKELGIEGTLFDIDNNIRAGSYILSKYIKRYGHEEGIARYYRGSLKVDGRAYYKKVQKAMHKIAARNDLRS